MAPAWLLARPSDREPGPPRDAAMCGTFGRGEAMCGAMARGA
jgi:hypothetical protein